jgi:enamine deaminase RidA (YjgF/YER057c/UK114 family)
MKDLDSLPVKPEVMSHKSITKIFSQIISPKNLSLVKYCSLIINNGFSFTSGQTGSDES